MPREQIDIRIGDHKIGLYNFNENLSEQQLDILQDALKSLSMVNNGGLVKNIKYILISNTSEFNTQSGENYRGRALRPESAVKVYLEGLDIGPYGRMPEVLNFDAIIIHEFTHHLRDTNFDFLGEWIKRFNWILLDEPRKLRGGEITRDVTKSPERCVSEYATSSPDEDICESMVAALRNPGVLDAEKLESIRRGLLMENKPEEVKITKAETVNLPKIGSLKYKVKTNKIVFRPV